MPDGLDNLIANMRRLSASGRAGVLDDEENATKLWFNEMGTKTAPARPTITVAWEKRNKDVAAKIESATGRAVDAAAAGINVDGEAIVGGAAADFAEAIVAQIDSNTPPPLAESTVRGRLSRGNSSTATLVDTGALRAAVRAETKPGADGGEDA